MHLVKEILDDSDIRFMRHALALARRGQGICAPNPSVGCVIVNDGRIVGRAVTGRGGRPHAESIALTQAGKQAKGADVYVTLEPCAHTGQTPPCAAALIEADVRRVFIGVHDPDPRVNGGGVKMLSDAGIDVIKGVLEEEARAVHSGFLKRITQNRPHVTLKVATSLDGKIALKNGESQWITGKPARAHVHYLRSTHDGILTGIGTAIKDNPTLTARLPGFNHRMMRFVLDTHLRLLEDVTQLTCASNLIKTSTDHPLFILHNKNTEEKMLAGKRDYTNASFEHIPLNDAGMLDLRYVLNTLAQRGINRLLVEGGAGIFTSFIKAGLWDELYWYRAPKLMGGDAQSAIESLGLSDMVDVETLEHTSTRHLGVDVLDVYTPSTKGV